MSENKKLNFDLDSLDKNSKHFEADRDKLNKIAAEQAKAKETADQIAAKAKVKADQQAARAAKRGNLSNNKAGSWVVGLIFLGLLIWGVTSGSSSSSSTASPSGTTAAQHSGVQVGQYWCSNSDADTANSMQPSVSEGNYILSQTNYLNLQSNKIDSDKSSLDTTYVSQNSPQYAIDAYNSAVDAYNNELAQYKAAASALEARRATYNNSVDAYNSYLDNNCSKN